MSQLGRPGKVSSNVYTVMLIVGTLVLGALVGVLWTSNTKMTGDDNPMKFDEVKPYDYISPKQSEF